MKQLLSVLVTLALPLTVSAAHRVDSAPPLACATLVLKTPVVLGERLVLRHVVRNTSKSRVAVFGEDHWGFAPQTLFRPVGGKWLREAEWPPLGIPTGDSPFVSFGPGEEVRRTHGTESTLLRTPGSYEVQRVLRFEKWPDLTKPPPDAWAGTIECTPARIEVVEPAGVDAEAFAAFGPYSLYSNRRKLVEAFPTSIYAGYVLTLSMGSLNQSTVSTALSRETTGRRLITAPPESRPDTEKRAERIEEEAVFTLSAIETFLAAHPDFVLRARLQINRAALLAYFGRYEEAWKVAKSALPEEEYPIWKRDGQQLLDLLVERGWVKPE